MNFLLGVGWFTIRARGGDIEEVHVVEFGGCGRGDGGSSGRLAD